MSSPSRTSVSVAAASTSTSRARPRTSASGFKSRRDCALELLRGHLVDPSEGLAEEAWRALRVGIIEELRIARLGGLGRRLAVETPVVTHVLLEERVPSLLVGPLRGGQAKEDPLHWLVDVDGSLAVQDHQATLASVIDHRLERAVVPVVHPEEAEVVRRELREVRRIDVLHALFVPRKTIDPGRVE